VKVRAYASVVYFELDGTKCKSGLPLVAQDFIKRFDDGGLVGPITFYIDAIPGEA